MMREDTGENRRALKIRSEDGDGNHKLIKIRSEERDESHTAIKTPSDGGGESRAANTQSMNKTTGAEKDTAPPTRRATYYHGPRDNPDMRAMQSNTRQVRARLDLLGATLQRTAVAAGVARALHP